MNKKKSIIISCIGILILLCIFACTCFFTCVSDTTDSTAISIEDVIEANSSLTEILAAKKQIVMVTDGDSNMMGDTLQSITRNYFYLDGEPVAISRQIFAERVQDSCIWNDRSYCIENGHLLTSVDLTRLNDDSSAWEKEEHVLSDLISPYVQFFTVADEARVTVKDDEDYLVYHVKLPNDSQDLQEMFRIEKKTLYLTEVHRNYDGSLQRIRIQYGDAAKINTYNLLDLLSFPMRTVTVHYNNQTNKFSIPQNSAVSAYIGEDIDVALFFDEAHMKPYSFDQAGVGDFTVWA